MMETNGINYHRPGVGWRSNDGCIGWLPIDHGRGWWDANGLLPNSCTGNSCQTRL